MALSRNLKEFLSLLVKHEVRFLLVGSHAVAVHGYVRNTVDIDFWLRRDADNARRVLAALDEFGFGSLGLVLDDLLAEKAVIQFGRPPNRIDLLTFLTALDFDDCFARRYTTSYDGVPIDVIGLDDLLRNKQATGRLKDRADVDEFERSGAAQRSEHAED